MTGYWKCFLVCFILFLEETSCIPIDRVPRNEIQFANGTVVGTYSYTDSGGNPIAVKYYADKIGYGVEINSFKTFKIVDTSTRKEGIHHPKPVKDYMEPMKPLLDLAAEIMNFDRKLSNTESDETTTKHPDTLSHLEHVSKLIKLNTPDYEKYYQNEVKAPKKCEKDKVRVYLAKERRKKKNAVEDPTAKATTNYE